MSENKVRSNVIFLHSIQNKPYYWRLRLSSRLHVSVNVVNWISVGRKHNEEVLITYREMLEPIKTAK